MNQPPRFVLNLGIRPVPMTCANAGGEKVARRVQKAKAARESFAETELSQALDLNRMKVFAHSEFRKFL